MNAFASIFIGGIFLIIAGVIVFVIISGVRTWSSNNAASLLTLHSTVVAKRTEVSGGSGNSSATTRYYVTFEFDNGERTELIVGGNHYGMMVENDRGMLTYQGTRFKHFERDVQPQSGKAKVNFIRKKELRLLPAGRESFLLCPKERKTEGYSNAYNGDILVK